MSDSQQNIADLSPERRRLLELLRHQHAKPERARLLPLARSEGVNSFPLSFAQQRLWFLDQFQPGSSAYNLLTALRLMGHLNEPALARALDELARRHETLRTTFAAAPSGDGQPVQIIAPAPPPSDDSQMEVMDISLMPPAERDAAVQRAVLTTGQQPFDLQRGPLLRATLLRVAEAEHVLIVTLHHIAADGWSQGVLLREMLALYHAFAAGQPSPLPALPIQYADYAVWQRNWLQGPTLDTQLDYWRQQLADLPKLLLPTDHPRSAAQTITGARQIRRLEPELAAALHALSQREGATLFMTLVTAFQVLLQRYTGQDDIAVGSGIANRNRTEIEGLIGFFVNTLVLRAKLHGNPTFRQALRQMREVTLAAYQHQDLPFEKLVEELQPERDLNSAPLFQVSFVLQNTPLPSFHLPGLRIELLETEHVSSKLDLDLSIAETSQGLRLRVQYNAELFEATTIERLLGHFHCLLEGIVADPDRRIATLPLLTDAEARQLLYEWNVTEREVPAKQGVHLLVEAQAQRTPDALAVIAEDACVTYGELNARANQLAHALRAQGVGPQREVRVGIALEPSIELVVALLGVLKAGGCYVPLDPSYPQERLRWLFADSQIVLLLTEQRLVERLPATDVPLLCLDADWTEIAAWPTSDPAVQVSPDQLAYMIYTSGSTGLPKGVLIAHRSVTNYMQVVREHYTVEAGDRVLQFASISFDVSMEELLVPLTNGATVVVRSEEMLASPAAFATGCVQQQITVVSLPTAFWHLLAEASANGSFMLPPTIRLLIIGGEQAMLPRLRQWQAQYGTRTRLVNLYGPTETTISATAEVVPAAIPETQPDTTIGTSLGNMRTYVLDQQMQPVPLGVPGELYIGGAGLARGYLNRPDLTAEKFVPHPWSHEPGARLYRTGDRVRVWPDGRLLFLGRVDQQVKLRGFRIELGEIESALMQHPTVSDAVVVVREDHPGDQRLVAYIVGNKEQRNKGTGCHAGCPLGMAPGAQTEDSLLGASELRSYLQGRLPAYMVPSAFVLLDTLPLTANGKVDRKALPAPDRSRSETDALCVTPRTPLEELIAGVWATVLHLEQVGIHDNFFALGGHSLLATQVVTRLRQMLTREIPLRVLFEAPTIAAFARQIEGQAATVDVPLVAMPRDGTPLPLSFAQQRLWFLDQLQPGSSAYTIPMVVRLRGALDCAALERSLSQIVERHAVLRTSFGYDQVAAQPFQQIAPVHAVALPVVPLPAEADAATLHAGISAIIRQPFDLQAGPLWRATLFQQHAHEHILVLVIHHSIFDGWSQSVLLHELSTLYQGWVATQPHRVPCPEGTRHGTPLPPLPIQYADYAMWQRHWLQGSLLEQQLDYWRAQLADVSPLDLPTDAPRLPLAPARSARSAFQLPVGLTSALRRLSQREGATLFMTLLAAFDVLLQRYSGQDDIAVGTPIAGRVRPELEPLIGFFVNTLVLRTDLGGSPSFAELVARVRTVCLGAYAHQDVPFELVVEAVQPERDLSHSPLFQVMFILQNMPRAEISLPDLTLIPLPAEHHTATFDLTFMLHETPDGLRGQVGYRADLFDAAMIERLIGHYQTLLEAIVADPQQRIDRLPLLSEAERHQLLVAWNAATLPLSAVNGIHQLVEAQAARTPDAVAVIFDDQQVTYAKLNQWANQLAHYLRQHGVGSEVRVGIALEPSIALVVGLLGVLKAGGCYVPFDPAYPEERLRWLFADSQVALLLTEQRHVDHLPADSLTVLCLDRNWPQIITYPTSDPAVDISPDHLAYMIYTSGSTGLPKGTLLAHRGVLNNLQWRQQRWPLSGEDRVLLNYAVSFDPSVWNIFWPLCAGAQLVTIRPEVRYDSAALVRTIAEQRITVFGASPSQLAVLLYEPDITACTSLRYVVAGGEQLSSELQQHFHTKLPALLCNCYGPTEATIDTTFWPCPREETPPTGVIGRPVPNVQVYVLNRQMEPVPVGVPGELYIGGNGLARGYHRRPDLTAERFVPNPFSHPEDTRPGARLYRTGDLARYRADGNLEFLGRIDGQVKLRGFRIELGEIEARLRQHPTVSDAVVVVREDHPGDQRLVAYVVENKGTREPAPVGARRAVPGTSKQDDTGTAGHAQTEDTLPGATELRHFLQSKLPDYMVPSVFMLLHELPLTPTGKLDPKALPAPDRTELAVGFVAPRTPTEELIADVWSAVLKLEQVSIHDNFFALGGHSLLATQVVARLRHLLERDIPLRVLFEAPTIAALATQIGEQAAAVDAPLVAVPRDGTPLPLSFAQQRLWFLDQLEPGSAAYAIPIVARLIGTLDLTALERSLSTIVQRHEILRTTFAADHTSSNPVPYQQIAPPADLPLLCSFPTDADDAAVRAAVSAFIVQPFDLQQGPLVRGMLVQQQPDEHLLALVIHHSIFDGWSQRIVIQELTTLYSAWVQQQPITLPALPLQYADYATWQRQWLQGAVLEQQLSYWRTQLGPEGTRVAPLDLPTDYPRPSVAGTYGAQHSVELPAALSAALQRLGQQQGTTLFMTLLAAWQVLLQRYSGQDDIVVGTPIAGRVRPELEPLIGFFVNTLVLRTDFSGHPGFSEVLARVRTVCLGAYAHQDVPFELVVEAVQHQRDLSRSPLFQVMFALQNLPRTEISLPGLQMVPLPAETHTAKFDLTLTLSETAEGLRGQVSYRTDLFAAATIERLITHYQMLLEAVVSDPAQRIDCLPLLTEPEQRRLLQQWNATAIDDPSDHCLHDLVAVQATRTPDAIAVIFQDERLTYQDLDRRANQLAHYLQALGVGTEVPVGVYLHRSPEMMVALLAVLKAGGCYVPLDPAYPAERLQWMLHDSQAPVLLTQQPLLSLMPNVGGTIVCLDRDRGLITEQPITLPGVWVEPRHPAYIIYTSGSTGQPKGVVVTHESVVNYLGWFTHACGAEVQYLPALTKTTFDASLKQMFGPLLQGKAVWVIPDELLSQPALLIDALNCRPRVGLNCVPSLWSAILDAIESGSAAPPPALTSLFVGGEQLSSALVARSQRLLPDLQIWNLYGPTEATANASAALIGVGERITIGRPIANSRAYVLDRQLNPVPVGVPGELYLGGVGLARCYLNRPDLTAERFVPDPFAGNLGARLYRTGDRVRYLPDGRIDFLGRIDQQVKLRGYRIELGEIEAVLMQHPDVREAVVVLRKDHPLTGGHPDQRLVAYVVENKEQRSKGTKEQTEPGADVGAWRAVPDQWNNEQPGLNTSELRAFLRDRLPEYMVPSAFVLLDALPLTPNGKLDRRALPTPDAVRPTLDTIFAAPCNAAELALANIWQHVLGLDRVGVHDNFFALGGDSFLGLRVIAQAKQVGVNLTPRALFQLQTIRQLAAVAKIEHLIQADQHTITGPIESTPNHCEAFETYDVERQIWNISQLIEVDERLNPAVLKQVTDALLEHHDALRLRSAEGRSGWYQFIAPPGEETPFTLYDFSDLSAAEQHTAIETTATQLQKSLNLQRGPTLRIALFDLGPDKPSRLMMLVHHTVCDGYSSYVVLEDFHRAYAQLRHGQPIRLPRKTTSLQYYAQRLVEYTRSGMLDHELHYWVSEPRKALVPIPVDYPGIHTGGNAHRFTVSLSVAETQALQQALSSTDMHVQEVLLTAVALAFVAWMGPGPFLIDVEHHGRDTIFDDVDLSRTVGWLNYRVPLVVDLRGRSETASALQTIHQTLRELPNHGIGFGLLYYVSQDPYIAGQMRTIPRARVLFNYRSVYVDQGPSGAFESRPAKEFSGIPYNLVTQRRHLLLIDAQIAEGGLSIDWTYSHEVHRHDTIDRVAQTAMAYLRSLITFIGQSRSGADRPPGRT